MGFTTQDWWQLFVSTHGLVAVINSVLTAVFFGLLITTLSNAPLLIAGVTGAIIFVTSGYFHFRYQSQTFDTINEKLKVLFPSEIK